MGDQIAEAIRIHEPEVGRAAAARRADELLERVGIGRGRAADYPHQYSGGMRQRAMIALALACRPDVVVADEPTTALDVMIQAQILELLAELSREMGMGLILVTHDLGVVAQVCDRVVVMYGGRVAEEADTERLFADPQHPYTEAPACLVPRHRAPRPAPARHPGGAAAPGRDATGLPVRAALPMPPSTGAGPRCRRRTTWAMGAARACFLVEPGRVREAPRG